MDIDEIEDVLKKPNRIKQQEEGDSEMVISPPPPTGIHIEDRKTRDRRRNLAIKKAIK
jgi:hypothetical protein